MRDRDASVAAAPMTEELEWLRLAAVGDVRMAGLISSIEVLNETAQRARQQCNLSPCQARTVLSLSELGGSASAVELAEAMERSLPTVYAALNSLALLKFVHKQRRTGECMKAVATPLGVTAARELKSFVLGYGTQEVRSDLHRRHV